MFEHSYSSGVGRGSKLTSLQDCFGWNSTHIGHVLKFSLLAIRDMRRHVADCCQIDIKHHRGVGVGNMQSDLDGSYRDCRGKRWRLISCRKVICTSLPLSDLCSVTLTVLIITGIYNKVFVWFDKNVLWMVKSWRNPPPFTFNDFSWHRVVFLSLLLVYHWPHFHIATRLVTDWTCRSNKIAGTDVVSYIAVGFGFILRHDQMPLVTLVTLSL